MSESFDDSDISHLNVHTSSTSSTSLRGGGEASKQGKRPTLDRYREQLLGGSPIYSARGLAHITGTECETVSDFMLGIGLPVLDLDEVRFTEIDRYVYEAWRIHISEGLFDEATGRSLLHAYAHLSDRLTLWQMESVVEDAMRRGKLDDTAARLVALDRMREHIDIMEEMLLYSWRTHMEDLIQRVEQEVAGRGSKTAKKRFPLNRSLGFVDMVSYTSASQVLGGGVIDLIELFEEACRTTVTEAGGRVVKMIGDAVFFIADDLPTGLGVVMGLIENLQADERILPVRASLVRGDVFSRSGDVFGPPVNLASRLVDIAPVGRVLTDATTAAAIASDQTGGNYQLEEFPSANLRGFGVVSPYLISRLY